MNSIANQLGYLRSILVTAPLIFAYTGLFGTLSLLSSLVDATGRRQHAVSRAWARLILATSRIRVAVSGLDRLRRDVPYVFCVNHQSHMDIPIVLSALPFQFRFAAKKDLFRYPFLGWHLRRSGHIPVDRENPRAAIKAMRGAAESLREGTAVVIFPEGQTSRTGEILPFKGGSFLLAMKLMAEVVPVTIRGSRSVLTPGTYHVRKGEVTVVVGTPIPSRDLSASEMAERVRSQILGAFSA